MIPMTPRVIHAGRTASLYPLTRRRLPLAVALAVADSVERRDAHGRRVVRSALERAEGLVSSHEALAALALRARGARTLSVRLERARRAGRSGGGARRSRSAGGPGGPRGAGGPRA